MQKIIAEYLGHELPRINAFLKDETDKLDSSVRPPIQHVLAAGGKRLRPLLTLLAARALGAKNDAALPLACSLEFLHSATLLHDDILDEADLRRGRQSAHIIYGRSETILAGDVLLALANRLVAGYGEPRLTDILSEAIMRTATGEVKEIANVRNTELSNEDYLDIITGKTAYLFQAACECGAIIAGCPKEVEDAAHNYGLYLGIAFQLVDDALDYVSPSDVSGKPSGGDLREGKLTLPLIGYFAQLEPARREELEDKFRQNLLSEKETADILHEITALNLPQQTREAARSYVDQAREALKKFPDTPEREVLDSILDFVLSREK
ncbi:polyprenyl synthetase family protein [Desulfobaculum bizertense]|uniref:Octaprenyl-diphosphate synthase n=1 Tax=Desulfobaculum bizertense DSM 18034 TaxID=1121442 RepID=A0A1T4WUE4_9BACT|nr:polyprenyl synthetase family protein [Desulfobaculum bizertense]UIJ37245.1 polyprenyl synthetase family protein [Desulfobaculum bizertense]SKA80251.1 octaprenyl-diphosphate synthase [Desulfobaculum bizertense DSM 18034]